MLLRRLWMLDLTFNSSYRQTVSRLLTLNDWLTLKFVRQCLESTVKRCCIMVVTPPTAKRWLSVVKCVRQQSVYFVKCLFTNNTKSSQRNDRYLKHYCSPSSAHTRSRRTSGPLGWPLNTLQASPLPPLSSADLQRPPPQDAGLHRSNLRRVRSLLDPRHTLTRYRAPI